MAGRVASKKRARRPGPLENAGDPERDLEIGEAIREAAAMGCWLAIHQPDCPCSGGHDEPSCDCEPLRLPPAARA